MTKTAAFPLQYESTFHLRTYKCVEKDILSNWSWFWT